jgi:phosphoglycerate dehydrogenase-like enzyme
VFYGLAVMILVSESVFHDHGARLATIAPDARWLRLQTDGTLVLDDKPVDAAEVEPDAAFVSNDVFYGPVRECFALLAGWRSLRWVQSAAAGTETPIYRTLLERDTRLTRAHVTAVPIAEYVLRAVLTHFQQPQRWEDARARHEWKHQSFREVWRTNWLVVGLGSIGGEVAARARAFGAHVVGVRRNPTGAEPVDEMITPTAVLAALPRADVVVIAAAGSDDTRGMVDTAFLAAMKPGSVFVNVARGNLVDEDALFAALDRGIPEVAILDVFVTEPLPPDSPFWDHPRVVLTPHSSGGGNGRVQRAVDLFAENLARWQRNEPFVHELTMADLPAVSQTWVVEKR